MPLFIQMTHICDRCHNIFDTEQQVIRGKEPIYQPRSEHIFADMRLCGMCMQEVRGAVSRVIKGIA